MPASLLIEPQSLKEAAMIYRAINNKQRQTILKLLHKNEQMQVMNIYKKLRMVQSITSVHLAVLRKANLVFAERSGQKIFYSVNYKRLQELHTIANSYLNKKEGL